LRGVPRAHAPGLRRPAVGCRAARRRERRRVKPRPAAPSSRDHYSYQVYADPVTAQTFDDRRFGGPIGEIVADTQARILSEFLAPTRGRTILDVGTGTGR